MIEGYQFGEIKINGKVYQNDVLVSWRNEVLAWWRKEGHRVFLEDLEEALKRKPEMIIIGTGAYNMMEVSETLKQFLIQSKIEVIVAPTSSAIKIFKEKLNEGKKVIGLFHLTC